MSAHPAPRATPAIRAETAGSSGLALGPNQRGKGGGEAEASIPVIAMAHQRTRGRAGRRARRNLAAAAVSDATRPDRELIGGSFFSAFGCWRGLGELAAEAGKECGDQQGNSCAGKPP